MAIMRIDQAANSSPTGTVGKARRDIWKDQPVSLVSTDDGTCTWTLLDKPPGSASAPSAGSGTPVTVTPDTYGTYRVKLVDSNGGIQIRIFRVVRDNAGVLQRRGWALPALLECSGLSTLADLAEADDGANARGYDDVWETIVSDLLANGFKVIFDGGATSENVRTTRATKQSPIDNTKDGIVNMSSDTTGTSPGAAASYATIAGGDANEVAGDYATCSGGQGNVITGTYSTCVGGLGNSVGGDRSVCGGSGNATAGLGSTAFGSGCTASAQGSTALGENCTASQEGAFACGSSCTATGIESVSLGGGCNASGHASFACGFFATADKWAEFAHGGDTAVAGADRHWVHLAAVPAAAPAHLLLGDTTELVLPDGFTYSIIVRVFAKDTGGGTRAKEVHELLADVTGGVLTIEDDSILSNPVINFATAGWTFTITTDGANALRLTLDPVASTVNVKATVEWSAIPNT